MTASSASFDEAHDGVAGLGPRCLTDFSLKTCSRRTTWPSVSRACFVKAASTSRARAAFAIFGSALVSVFFSAK